MLPLIIMFLCKCLCVIRDTFRRTRLEQASAHRCDPGALLPAVCRDPAGRVPRAGTPLCLRPSLQARPRGSSGQPDSDVSWHMPQRSDLWHEHLWLWIRWGKYCKFGQVLWSWEFIWPSVEYHTKYMHFIVGFKCAKHRCTVIVYIRTRFNRFSIIGI